MEMKGPYSLLSCICNTFQDISTVDGDLAGIVRVYPNLTRGQVYVTSGDIITGYCLCDVQGVLLLSKEGGSRDISFDLSSLPAGLYFLNMVFDDKIRNIRIIKINGR